MCRDLSVRFSDNICADATSMRCVRRLSTKFRYRFAAEFCSVSCRDGGALRIRQICQRQSLEGWVALQVLLEALDVHTLDRQGEEVGIGRQGVDHVVIDRIAIFKSQMAGSCRRDA